MREMMRRKRWWRWWRWTRVRGTRTRKKGLKRSKKYNHKESDGDG